MSEPSKEALEIAKDIIHEDLLATNPYTREPLPLDLYRVATRIQAALDEARAEVEQQIWKEATKFYLEKMDKVEERSDAIYAFYCGSPNLFALDIQKRFDELTKAFNT